MIWKDKAKAKAEAEAKVKDDFLEIKKTVQAEVCFWAPV